MRKASVVIERKEVARQPKVAPDAKLIAMCDKVVQLDKNANAAWSSGNEAAGDEIFDIMHSLLDKIIKTKPKTQDGLRKKAATLFGVGDFYQWPSGPEYVQLSDKVVAALLRDIGVAQPIFV